MKNNIPRNVVFCISVMALNLHPPLIALNDESMYPLFFLSLYSCGGGKNCPPNCLIPWNVQDLDTAGANEPSDSLDSEPTDTAASDSWLTIDAGGWHSCGIQMDRVARCWGRNDEGQSTPPADLQFQQFAAGRRFTCGMRTDSYLECWGADDDGETSPPNLRFVQIDAGKDNACGILEDQTLRCWGNDAA